MWLKVATKFNLSSRQKLKFYDFLVTFKDLLVTIPCLTYCLSFTINNYGSGELWKLCNLCH